MTQRRRNGGIAASVLIFAAGLVAAVAAPAAVRPAAALAATAAPAVNGTDVSNMTTVNSWPSVRSAGMSFVGVEAVDGASVINTSYQSEVTGALGQGLFVMPYVVADPLKTTGAAQFTDHAWPVISSVAGAPYGPGGQYLPVVLDLESQAAALSTNDCYGLSPAAMKSWISDFIAAAEAKTGMVPVIYTNPNWWQECTGNTTDFTADPLWIADWDVNSPQIPPGWPGYTFWQSSSTATITGIQGTSQADLDQMEGTPAVLTAAAGSGGSVQVMTLNSLAGQQVSYSAAPALPAGIALSPSGQLSWTSAAQVGAHALTITPATVPPSAAAVFPSSVSLTLRVHGTIALSVKNRSSTAGAPVWLRIGSSGPDQSAGFAAAVKAAGLPAGLSVSPAGVITGWLTRPGTYTVTVTATDGLGGAGKASFTWTVRAAADSGPTGEIRQDGGSGKCLNDPGGRTASGTRITLWNCLGNSSQKWTAVADGTLRVHGKCLGIAGDSRSNGARLVLAGCDSRDGAQLWQAASAGQLVNPRSGKCLDVQAARASNGANPVIEPCTNSTARPNEHWLRPAAGIVSGIPGQCIRASGTAVVLASCANVAAERWQPRPDGTIRVGGQCLTEAGTAAGAVLTAGRCSGGASARWTLISRGPVATGIVNSASHRCVTVPSKGTRLIIAACAASPGSTWQIPA